MAEITDSFCERCGTHYTFDAPRPKKRLGSARLFAKAARNFVMSDSTSVSDAMELARHDEEREVSNAVVSQFHSTFNFCMSCRQYTCENCWNERDGACLSCAPAGSEDASRVAAAETPDAAPSREKPSVLEWPAADLERAEVMATGNGHLPAEPALRVVEPAAAAGTQATPLQAAAPEPEMPAPAEVPAIPESPEPAEPEVAAAPVQDFDLELTAEELQLAEKQLADSQPPADAAAFVEATAAEAEAGEAEQLIAEIEEIQRALAAQTPPAPEPVAEPLAVNEESPEEILTAEELAEIEAHLEIPAVAATAEIPQVEAQAVTSPPAHAPERPHGLLSRFIHRAAPEPAPEPLVEAEVESVAEEVVEAPAAPVWPQPTAWAESPIHGSIIDWDALDRAETVEPAQAVEAEPVEAVRVEAVEPIEVAAAEAVEPEAVEPIEPAAVEPIEAAAVAVVEPDAVEAVELEPTAVEAVATEVELVAVEAVEPEPAEVEPVAAEPAAETPPVGPESVAAPEPAAAIQPVAKPVAPQLPSPAPAWPRPQVPPPWASPQAPLPHAALPPQWRRSSTAASDAWDDSARQLLARPSGARACKQCALPISTNARFCRRCGTRQDADEPVGAGSR